MLEAIEAEQPVEIAQPPSDTPGSSSAAAVAAPPLGLTNQQVAAAVPPDQPAATPQRTQDASPPPPPPPSEPRSSAAGAEPTPSSSSSIADAPQPVGGPHNTQQAPGQHLPEPAAQQLPQLPAQQRASVEEPRPAPPAELPEGVSAEDAAALAAFGFRPAGAAVAASPTGSQPGSPVHRAAGGGTNNAAPGGPGGGRGPAAELAAAGQAGGDADQGVHVDARWEPDMMTPCCLG